MANSIRIYTDEHISKSIIKGLRHRGIDVLTCAEAGFLSASDINHMKFALERGRVILTKDTDFLKLHMEKNNHAGIIYANPNTSVGNIIQKVFLIWYVIDSKEMINHIEFI